MQTPKYKRILLKISGEALAGEKHFGLDFDVIGKVCDVVKQCIDMGVQVGIVIGGGNFWRGVRNGTGKMERTRADHMGMLATTINALALADALEQRGVPVRVQTAIEMNRIAEPYIRQRATRHLEKGRVVICAAGTGNPYFTTDTTAALRGMELQCDAIIKATKVDGIYDKDPAKFPDAVKYDSLSYDETLSRHLGVMDAAAFALVRDNNVPIIVCRMLGGDIRRAILGEQVGTIVHDC